MSQTVPTVAGPSRAGAIGRLVVGLLIAAAGIYLVFDNLDRTRPGKDEKSTVIVLAVILGMGIALLVGGAVGLVGKRFGWGPSLGALVAAGAMLFFILPGVFTARQVRDEQEAWNRLQASGKKYVDYKSYADFVGDPPPQRKGVMAAMAMAETQEEIAKPSERWGRVASLRSMLKGHLYQMEKTGEAEFQAAIDLARKTLAADYAKALGELNKQVESGPEKSEFPADPAMRAAFAKILERVAATDDDRVYVDFSSDTQVTDPDRSAEKVLNPGEAFSAEQETRRRDSFAKALSESLKKGFGNEQLITFETLPASGDRKGKVIFEVKCATRRTAGGFKLTREGWEDRVLFNFEVNWDTAIVDADGKTLATNQSRSNPAGSVTFMERKGDPFWAPYSVLMDSAYYNYAREIAGRLGLEPPAVKRTFRFGE